MAALDFPSSPSIGQVYTANGKSWLWDGVSWNNVAPASIIFDGGSATSSYPGGPVFDCGGAT